ncbi:hypothetical protein ACFW93_11565 [Streptomyces canus]|uniref:hypothetical protein n=1 Tax=Streptomyces canus TaxID=58343 RepID=UPI0036AE22F4
MNLGSTDWWTRPDRAARTAVVGTGRKGPRCTAAAADLFAEIAAESARCGAVSWEAHSLRLGAPLEAAAGSGRGATHAWLRGRRLAEAGGSGMLVGPRRRHPSARSGSEAPYRSPDRTELIARPATLTARELTAELVARGSPARPSRTGSTSAGVP